jgi:hypothetical protein
LQFLGNKSTSLTNISDLLQANLPLLWIQVRVIENFAELTFNLKMLDFKNLNKK